MTERALVSDAHPYRRAETGTSYSGLIAQLTDEEVQADVANHGDPSSYRYLRDGQFIHPRLTTNASASGHVQPRLEQSPKSVNSTAEAIEQQRMRSELFAGQNFQSGWQAYLELFARKLVEAAQNPNVDVTTIERPEISVRAIPSISRALEDAESIRGYEDNWDEEGSRKPSIDALNAAAKFVIRLATELQLPSDDDSHDLDFMAARDGGIVVSWINPSERELILSFPVEKDGDRSFLAHDNGRGNRFKGSFDVETSMPVFVAWLSHG